jgi:hypothetical protein
MDQNSPHTVKSLVPEMANVELVDNDCVEHVFCGMPYLMPALSFIWYVHDRILELLHNAVTCSVKIILIVTFHLCLYLSGAHFLEVLPSKFGKHSSIQAASPTDHNTHSLIFILIQKTSYLFSSFVCYFNQ